MMSSYRPFNVLSAATFEMSLSGTGIETNEQLQDGVCVSFTIFHNFHTPTSGV